MERHSGCEQHRPASAVRRACRRCRGKTRVARIARLSRRPQGLRCHRSHDVLEIRANRGAPPTVPRYMPEHESRSASVLRSSGRFTAAVADRYGQEGACGPRAVAPGGGPTGHRGWCSAGRRSASGSATRLRQQTASHGCRCADCSTSCNRHRGRYLIAWAELIRPRRRPQPVGRRGRRC
jgi:hypothetical protein